MDEFKSNVTRLVNISKIVDQPVNIAVSVSRMRAGKFGGKIRRENSAGKLVAARTKSLFLQFWLLFSSKNKNGAPRETLCPSYRLKMKLENSLYKKTPKALNMPQGLLYVCISTLILVINLFCFNNCGLFCLCYITKHLMTAPSENICFVSLECKCFFLLRLGKTLRFLGNETDVSLVIK